MSRPLNGIALCAAALLFSLSCTINIYRIEGFGAEGGRLRPAGAKAGGEALAAQVETCRRMREIATAVESYRVDYDRYPVARSLAELRPSVEPTYIEALPTRDAWGNPLLFQSTADHFEIRSRGADGKPNRAGVAGPFEDPDLDILMQDFRFVEFPLGALDPRTGSVVRD